MCGIAGLVSRAPLTREDLARIARVQDGLAHRGPDGGGQFQHRHVALAMRRLSIIDLATGWQPLYNEDQSLAIVANGEIYNYIELRQTLQGQGHIFKTLSDIEVIPHLYEEYGMEFVHHLRGMFAFALWDQPRQRLIIGRDRMGEKPLYLFETPNMLLFASEMKGLLASGLVPFELDPAAVNQFLHYQWVPEPKTILKHVTKLPAAHLLTIDVPPWRFERRPYWSIANIPSLEGNPAELIRKELETVADIVIRSDVPVGIALSGGLDSSALAALASKRYPGTMEAFSVGYEGHPRQDERAMAKELADHLKMPLHDIEVRIEDMVEFFPELNYWRDDPIADIAGHGYYALAKAARTKNVPVLLLGQGGDELFWGYPWVQALVSELQASEATPRNPTLSQPRRTGVSSLRHFLPQGTSRAQLVEYANRMGGALYGWKPLRSQNSIGTMDFYGRHTPYLMSQFLAKEVFSSTFLDAILADSSPRLFSTAPGPLSPQLRAMSFLFSGYLRENGLAQADRLAAASSVELRVPLVDARLVELVVGLRKTIDDSQLSPKIWFKEAIRGLLPTWVLNRPKRGFNPPVLRWTRALQHKYSQDLLSGYLVTNGILSAPAAYRFTTAKSPLSPWLGLCYSMLVLEWWCRRMSSIGQSRTDDHTVAMTSNQ